MLDKDLAEMYGVETRVLKQSVKRNDVECMVSQNVIPSKSEFGGASPFCFTEQGVTMLSCILNSTTVVQANTRIVSVPKLRQFKTRDYFSFEPVPKFGHS